MLLATVYLQLPGEELGDVICLPKERRLLVSPRDAEVDAERSEFLAGRDIPCNDFRAFPSKTVRGVVQ